MKDPIFILIIVFLLSVVSCSMDGDDDSESNPDDDAADDSGGSADDSVTTDDTVPADDTQANDDQTDDSGGDDSDDDTANPPDGLLIVVQGPVYTKSFLSEDGQWTEFAVPVPPNCSLARPCFFGPSFVLNGQSGFASWEVMGLGYPSEPITLENDWVDFDPGTGWRPNTDRPQAGLDSWTQLLSVPAQNDFWVIDFTIWMTAGYAVHHFESGAFVPKLAADEFLTMDFTGPDSGVISGFNLYPLRADALAEEPFLVKWDGSDLAELPYPAAFGDLGVLHAKYADDSNGFVVLSSYDLEQRAVAELSDGVWSLVPAPSGCEDSTPGFVNFTGDHVIVAPNDFDENDHLWERMGGNWRCRRLDAVTPPITNITRLVMSTNGECVVGTSTIEGQNRHVRLFKIEDDRFREILLPGDFKALNGMHLFGPHAQPYSSDMISAI